MGESMVLDFGIGDVSAQQHAEYVAAVLRNPRHRWADAIADQIEAQTKPPKPTEPTGLGAVVEDAHGKRWTHAPESDDDVAPWVPHRNGGGWFTYDQIDVVKVLSEGVA